MLVSAEIVTCVAAILGCLKLTAAEFSRLRKTQQLRQAQRRAFANAALQA